MPKRKNPCSRHEEMIAAGEAQRAAGDQAIADQHRRRQHEAVEDRQLEGNDELYSIAYQDVPQISTVTT